ncbi:MAG: hypothetical protein QXU77_05580 [Desulfurococcaceae archaeon]
MNKIIYIIVAVLIVLITIILIGINQQSIIPQSSVKTTTSSITSNINKLTVYDIIPKGFDIVENIVYFKFKVIADIDLRDYIEINGVYGSWIGVITAIVPNGKESYVFTPPDYSEIRNQFKYLNGSIEYATPVYDLLAWYQSETCPQSSLNGTYRIKILLSGPYDEKTGEYPKVLLMEKNFTYNFKISIELKTLEWKTWDQDVEITLINEGDVPVFFTGAAILVHGVNTVIGYLNIQNPSQYIYIDTGEFRNITTKLSFFDEYVPYYRGKTIEVDVLFEFETIQFINTTYTIKFPE